MKDNEQKYRRLLKDAVLKLDKMQSGIDAMKKKQNEPVAIIGMGCRFPGGADSPDAYWRMLRNGTDAITEVPSWRWDVEEYCASEPDALGKIVTSFGGFLDQVDHFDPEFFNISPREAITMDPQQRLLLEVTWEALEHANQVPGKLFRSATGVFVGISCFDYAMHIIGPGYDDRADAYSGTGALLSPSSGRISYVLGLTGPSMSVDTACSSSLLAVHLACQSLRTGECDMALAGGVNLFVSPGLSIAFSRAGMLSPDGRCKAFDSSANGYVRSEGCGMIVLRRLSDALKQKENILGLIRGSAVNQDGASGALTAPSGPSQEEVVRAALNNTEIDPSTVGYIECHGTGTSLGDPIEMTALGNVLCKNRSPDQPLLVGSVKTNIGHSEPASGVAGIIKILLSMRHKQIPPHLHLKNPNPLIPWDTLPVRIPDQCIPWPEYDGKRIAGVNSFGFSGTNVHVVLEEFKNDHKSVSSAPVRIQKTFLLTLSARKENALKEMAKLYAAYISDTDASLGDICFTANSCRSLFNYRLGIVATSSDNMQEMLLAFASGEKNENIYYGVVQKYPEIITSAMEVMEKSEHAGDAFSHLAGLYVKGNFVDWKDFGKTFHLNRVILPTYPFQRQKYWIEGMFYDTHQKDLPDMPVSGKYHPLIGRQLNLPCSDEVRFEVRFSPESPAYLNEHRLFDKIVVPAAAYISMVFTALEKAFGTNTYCLKDMVFPEALLINHDEAHTAQLILSPQGDQTGQTDQTGLTGPTYSFQVLGSAQNKDGSASWRTHSSGTAEVREKSASITEYSHRINAESAEVVSGKDFYADYERTGYGWGPSFQWLDDIQKTEKQAFCRIRTPLLTEKPGIYALHPGLIDSLFHLLFNCRKSEHSEMAADSYIYVPFHIDSFTLHAVPGSRDNLRAYASTVNKTGNSIEGITGDLFLTDDNDELIAEVTGFNLRKMRETAFLRNLYQDIRKLTYRISWIQSETFQPLPLSEPANQGAWMIFADTEGLGTVLAELLRGQGEQCVLVSPGERYDNRYGETDNDHYCISPGSPEDYQRLFKETGDLNLKGLVHLWSPGTFATEASDAASLQADQVVGCQSVLYMVQSLMNSQPATLPRIWLVTRGAQPVSTDDKSLNIAQAPVWGLARVIDLEYPEIRCTSTDMDPYPDKAEIHNLFKDIMHPDQEKQIGWRKGVRYKARLRQANLPVSEKPFAVDENSSFLITGASGALGNRLVRWLAEKGARHLILVCRKLSEPLETLISEMENIGIIVRTMKADITDYENMSGLFAKISENMPVIKGVFHLAGVLDDGILLQQDRIKFEKVMGPKLEGAWNLHLLTRGLPLDFFIMYSSAVSVIGSPAQGNYAAANAFLDALAHFRQKSGLPGTSINWGPWDETGMAAELTSAGRRRLMDRGLIPIPPEQGMAALEDILQTTLQTGLQTRDAQLSVIAADWSRLSGQFSEHGIPSFLADMAEKRQNKEPVQASSFMTELQKATLEKRSRMLFELVQKACVQVSGFDQAPKPDIPLGDQGFDSLMGVELRNQLSKELNIPLSSAMVFNYPTITEIVQYLETKIPEISPDENTGKTVSQDEKTVPQDEKSELDYLDDLTGEELKRMVEKDIESVVL